MGELKGFPAPTGESRVWRVAPDARHEVCGSSPACSVVADGFTSIIDLAFGRQGRLYVVELEEASWFALEGGLPTLGGTVNACSLRRGTCTAVATNLPMVTVAISRGDVYAVIFALVPGRPGLCV